MTDWPLTEDRREELIDGLRKHKDDPIVTDVINLLHRLPRYIAQERSETAVATMGNIVSLNEAMIDAGYDATRTETGAPQFADAGFCLGHAAKIYDAMIGVALDQMNLRVAVETQVSEGKDVGKAIMDEAWPALGGNHNSAEFWDAFAEGVTFTLTALGKAP